MSDSVTLVCLACQMPGPPPEMTCTLGRDHWVGVAAGCPACGRPTRAPAARARPCAVLAVTTAVNGCRRFPFALPAAQHAGCPAWPAVAGPALAGDGVAGAGAAEAVRLVIAQVAGGGRDPDDHRLVAAAVRGRVLTGIGGAMPPGGPGTRDWLPVLVFRRAMPPSPTGTGWGVRGRDIRRDTRLSLRWYVHVQSRWDRDIAEPDQGYPGELAALADHVGGDPGGRLHGGEPIRRGRTGQGVAAAFGGGHPGDLGVVDQAGGFADADHAASFDPGVPFDPGPNPNVIRHSDDV